MPILITLIEMNSLTFCLRDPWVSTSQFAKHNALARACNIKVSRISISLQPSLINIALPRMFSTQVFLALSMCLHHRLHTMEAFSDTYSKDTMQYHGFLIKEMLGEIPVMKLNRRIMKEI